MRLRSIRVFHYNREKGEYEAADFLGTATLREAIRSEDGGANRRRGGSVRLMTTEDISVAPEDYVSLVKDEAPDKNRDFFVTEVSDNRRGHLPHWRLTAEGRSGR